MTAKQVISIAGVDFTPERFPKLYSFAQNNPEGLEAQLRSLNRASGGNDNDLTQDAINLEMDLQHG